MRSALRSVSRCVVRYFRFVSRSAIRYFLAGTYLSRLFGLRFGLSHEIGVSVGIAISFSVGLFLSFFRSLFLVGLFGPQLMCPCGRAKESIGVTS